MLVGRTTYDAVKQRQKSTGELSPKRIPLSSEFMSSKNSLNNIERPLKSNQNDLSFKGLSFKGENKPKKKDDKMKPLLATFGVLAATGLALRFAPRYKEAGNFKVTEFLEFAQKHMGVIKKDAKNPDAIVNSSIAEELFESVRDSELTKNLIKVDGDNVTFYKKTIPQLIWDGLIYPFKILPADILNGGVELIGKIKPFKGWAEKHYKNLCLKISDSVPKLMQKLTL